MQTHTIRAWLPGVILALVTLMSAQMCLASASFQDESARARTPLQLEIEKQRSRLSSADMEDRRDALIRLRSLGHPDASRAAVAALNDASPIIRATAASALLSLPVGDATGILLPLLADKDEFVRQHAAYALGRAGNNTAVAALIERLTDKQDSVRGAAAVALGQIADVQSVPALIAVLNPQPLTPTKKKSKVKRELNPLVLRAVARSLGQIGSRAASATLVSLVEDEKAESDVRREAVVALGLIRDEAALPVLRTVIAANDPYLAQAAYEAIRKISQSR